MKASSMVTIPTRRRLHVLCCLLSCFLAPLLILTCLTIRSEDSNVRAGEAVLRRRHSVALDDGRRHGGLRLRLDHRRRRRRGIYSCCVALKRPDTYDCRSNQRVHDVRFNSLPRRLLRWAERKSPSPRSWSCRPKRRSCSSSRRRSCCCSSSTSGPSGPHGCWCSSSASVVSRYLPNPAERALCFIYGFISFSSSVAQLFSGIALCCLDSHYKVWPLAEHTKSDPLHCRTSDLITVLTVAKLR